jgi:hypothetical protein
MQQCKNNDPGIIKLKLPSYTTASAVFKRVCARELAPSNCNLAGRPPSGFSANSTATGNKWTGADRIHMRCSVTSCYSLHSVLRTLWMRLKILCLMQVCLYVSSTARCASIHLCSQYSQFGNVRKLRVSCSKSVRTESAVEKYICFQLQDTGIAQA